MDKINNAMLDLQRYIKLKKLCYNKKKTGLDKDILLDKFDLKRDRDKKYGKNK